jgi:hypothetical protein
VLFILQSSFYKDFNKAMVIRLLIEQEPAATSKIVQKRAENYILVFNFQDSKSYSGKILAGVEASKLGFKLHIEKGLWKVQ